MSGYPNNLSIENFPLGVNDTCPPAERYFPVGRDRHLLLDADEYELEILKRDLVWTFNIFLQAES